MSDTSKAPTGKPWPSLRSDEAAERFVAEADLSEYDFSQFEPVRHEFEDKSARVTMRMSEGLLERTKAAAEKRGVPYQRFIREAIEKAL